MGRIKRNLNVEDTGDDAGLAGWLYTDLLLGLAVVFLAGTAFVVPQLTKDEVDADSVSAESTTSTSTTTTIPVEYCTSLYSVDGADQKEEGIWVVVNKSSNSDAVVDQFELGLRAELEAENPTLVSQGKIPWDFSNLKIGLLLVYGGFPGDRDANWGANDAERVLNGIRTSRIRSLFDGNSEFPKSIQRSFGTRSVGANQVGFDVYPYIESPC
jgi:hypothetical protein